MPIEYTDDAARFTGLAAVDEAENLLEHLQRHPRLGVDLGACTHLHTANLQVLLATGAAISVWPKDEGLRTWLGWAFTQSKGERP
jgi:phosphoglycolate phosphatase-like HAD superfamily hydrolase